MVGETVFKPKETTETETEADTQASDVIDYSKPSTFTNAADSFFYSNITAQAIADNASGYNTEELLNKDYSDLTPDEIEYLESQGYTLETKTTTKQIETGRVYGYYTVSGKWIKSSYGYPIYDTVTVTTYKWVAPETQIDYAGAVQDASKGRTLFSVTIDPTLETLRLAQERGIPVTYDSAAGQYIINAQGDDYTKYSAELSAIEAGVISENTSLWSNGSFGGSASSGYRSGVYGFGEKAFGQMDEFARLFTQYLPDINTEHGQTIVKNVWESTVIGRQIATGSKILDNLSDEFRGSGLVGSTKSSSMLSGASSIYSGINTGVEGFITEQYSRAKETPASYYTETILANRVLGAVLGAGTKLTEAGLGYGLSKTGSILTNTGTKGLTTAGKAITGLAEYSPLVVRSGLTGMVAGQVIGDAATGYKEGGTAGATKSILESGVALAIGGKEFEYGYGAVGKTASTLTEIKAPDVVKSAGKSVKTGVDVVGKKTGLTELAADESTILFGKASPTTPTKSKVNSKSETPSFSDYLTGKQEVADVITERQFKVLEGLETTKIEGITGAREYTKIKTRTASESELNPKDIEAAEKLMDLPVREFEVNYNKAVSSTESGLFGEKPTDLYSTSGKAVARIKKVGDVKAEQTTLNPNAAKSSDMLSSDVIPKIDVRTEVEFIGTPEVKNLQKIGQDFGKSKSVEGYEATDISQMFAGERGTVGNKVESKTGNKTESKTSKKPKKHSEPDYRIDDATHYRYNEPSYRQYETPTLVENTRARILSETTKPPEKTKTEYPKNATEYFDVPNSKQSKLDEYVIFYEVPGSRKPSKFIETPEGSIPNVFYREQNLLPGEKPGWFAGDTIKTDKGTTKSAVNRLTTDRVKVDAVNKARYDEYLKQISSEKDKQRTAKLSDSGVSKLGTGRVPDVLGSGSEIKLKSIEDTLGKVDDNAKTTGSRKQDIILEELAPLTKEVTRVVDVPAKGKNILKSVSGYPISELLKSDVDQGIKSYPVSVQAKTSGIASVTNPDIFSPDGIPDETGKSKVKPVISNVEYPFSDVYESGKDKTRVSPTASDITGGTGGTSTTVKPVTKNIRNITPVITPGNASTIKGKTDTDTDIKTAIKSIQDVESRSDTLTDIENKVGIIGKVDNKTASDIITKIDTTVDTKTDTEQKTDQVTKTDTKTKTRTESIDIFPIRNTEFRSTKPNKDDQKKKKKYIPVSEEYGKKKAKYKNVFGSIENFNKAMSKLDTGLTKRKSAGKKLTAKKSMKPAVNVSTINNPAKIRTPKSRTVKPTFKPKVTAGLPKSKSKTKLPRW